MGQYRNRYNDSSMDCCLSPLDQLLSRVHHFLFIDHRVLTIQGSVALYVIIVLFFGNILKISSNYFVLFPVITAALCYGWSGGLGAGILALPANLLLFLLIGHPEYSPASKLIAELSGIIVGTSMGYASDYFRKMNREMEKRQVSEEALRRTLMDRELLLRELNHRVRNNLSMINSLIQLHSNRVEDPLLKQECGKLKQRIFSMSLVHEQLFREGNSVFLDFRSYMQSLVENLLPGTGEKRIKILTSWPEGDFPVSSDRVIYLGLIVNEVLINSLKYAFDGTGNPVVSVELVRLGEEGLINIRDNGCGFTPSESSSGLGMKLIRSLSSHIDGNCEWKTGGGTSFSLRFPIR